MGRVRGAVNARALSLARKAVDLCNCWRREAAAECLVEKQVACRVCCRDPMNTPVRVGETIEGSRTMRNRPYPVLKCSRRQAGHRTAGQFLENRDALAGTHPWASASSYLPSQSLADSRCNLHATSRSSHSRRSLSCRFFLCRVALLRLVLRRRRRLPVPCSRCFLRLSAQLRPPRSSLHILAPRVYRALLEQGRVF